MSYLSIRDKIYDIVNGLKETGIVALFENVYKYDASNPKGSPVAMVFASGVENETETNEENKRTYTYTIRVEYDYKQIDEVTEEQVDEIVYGIADKVIDAIDNDYTLSGLVDYCVPTPAQLGWIDREGGRVRVAIFNVNAFILKDVTS